MLVTQDIIWYGEHVILCLAPLLQYFITLKSLYWLHFLPHFKLKIEYRQVLRTHNLHNPGCTNLQLDDTLATKYAPHHRSLAAWRCTWIGREAAACSPGFLGGWPLSQIVKRPGRLDPGRATLHNTTQDAIYISISTARERVLHSFRTIS